MYGKTICTPYTYRTPWCSMLGVCGTGDNAKILHLYYPLHELSEEINMLTATLGAHRSSESAVHLLDLVNMSKDETPQFFSFVKTAMAKVFDELGKFTRNVEKAYRFDEGHPTIVIVDGGEVVNFKKDQWVIKDGKFYIALEDGTSADDDLMSKLDEQPADFRHSVHYIIQWQYKMNDNFIRPLDQFVFDALKFCIIYEWLHIAYPSEEEPYLLRYQEALKYIRRCMSRLNQPTIDRIPRIF